MGVTVEGGSMSTTTDVIYTHKKFKKAAVESWQSNGEKSIGSESNKTTATSKDLPSAETSKNEESKEEPGSKCTLDSDNKFVCKVCGLETSKSTILQTHKCAYKGVFERPILCKVCRQTFTKNIDYMNHNCFKLNLSPRKKGEKCNLQNKSKEPEQKLIARSYNFSRSFSCPYGTETPKEASAVESNNERKTSIVVGNKEGKPPYKPKFRANYSYEEESKPHNIPQFFRSNSISNNSSGIKYAENAIPSTPQLTYQSSNESLQSSSQPLPCSSQPLPSSSQLLPSSSLINYKAEATADFHKNITSKCSAIWKGIKSPSPELVNQHITNLIVQNQAIVETNNPIWSGKYRRQSSSSSTSSEHEGNQSNKTRRSSVNEFSKGIRSKSKESEVNLHSSSLLSGLPKSYHPSVSPSRASNKPSISAPTSLSKVKTIDIYCQNSSPIYSENALKLQPTNYAERYKTHFYKLPSEPRKSVLTDDRHYLTAALHNSHDNYSRQISLDNHLEAHRLPPEQESISDSSSFHNNFERSSSRESCLSDPLHRTSFDEDFLEGSRSMSISPYEKNIFGSPPMKRKRLMSLEPNAPNKSPYTPMYPQNGKIYEFQMLDNLSKPKKNSNHIFGGEVKICNGKEYKTLKIDPSNSEGPSLDLCIASKHLAAAEAESPEISLPTSVVVTIAKSGLNSGGTMVKVNGNIRRLSSSSLEPPYSSSKMLSPLIPYSPKPLPSSSPSLSLQYPSVISVGEERVPFVPGMPGPYSQPGVIVKQPDQLHIFPVPSISPNRHSLKRQHPDQNKECHNIESNRDLNIESRYFCQKSPASNVLIIPKLPEIRVEPPVAMEEPPEVTENEKYSDEFLVPRKRPDTLQLDPQSSSSLIGSTLVSPDTPRPRKSCTQSFLNGSAYTRLNFKVSTKPVWCCVYPPQPMFVRQADHPNLSMYSNWKHHEKSVDPLNLSPVEAMGLHISGSYYNKSYTISKSKSTELIITPSSYWTDKTSGNSSENVNNEKEKEEEKEPSQRVKIFEGGFKTNEEYTYVRGRGRGRYVCETCGIRCKKPSMLKKHIRTHTDLRPFSCKHCSFSFKTKGNLSKHLKSKAHYKRCTDMGITPIPVTVDDSHINKEALQMQEMNSAQEMEDDDDEEEDDDDEEEEDMEEDEEMMMMEEEDPVPMDLSVKRPSVIQKKQQHLLPLREDQDILSPVTESSVLLKSIYETTSRLDKTPRLLSGQEVPCGNMLQTYLKERAVLESTRKRHQYLASPSPPSSVQCGSQSKSEENATPSVPESNKTCKIVLQQSNSTSTYIMASLTTPSRTRASTSNGIFVTAASTIPTPPANLTVVNTCDRDAKPAFIAPSGIIPTSSSRNGASDDGKCRCSICHKDFGKQAQLRLHMNIHFIERPHRCDSCGISFRTNGHLQKHRRSVSHFNKVSMNETFGAPSTSNPRPFKCHDCRVAFRIHGHLAKHLRSKLHIMKLECLGKLPFGTYAEIEQAGVNLNEIDTSDCENSLKSLQNMASRLYENDPSKLVAWQNQQPKNSDSVDSTRTRTTSNSSEDYAMSDDLQEGAIIFSKGNQEEESGDEDEPAQYSSSEIGHSSSEFPTRSILPPCSVGSNKNGVS